MRAQRLEHLSRGRIARLLHGDAVSRFDEHPAHQVEGLLRAIRDDEPAVLLINVRGAIEYLGPDGEVLGRVTSADRLETYRRWCEANGAPFLATCE
ncbi:hypothetical protein COSO111634_04690 [Corallococcus soli]|nr:hypothetical protein [Corallococcus soli]